MSNEQISPRKLFFKISEEVVTEKGRVVHTIAKEAFETNRSDVDLRELLEAEVRFFEADARAHAAPQIAGIELRTFVFYIRDVATDQITKSVVYRLPIKQGDMEVFFDSLAEGMMRPHWENISLMYDVIEKVIEQKAWTPVEMDDDQWFEVAQHFPPFDGLKESERRKFVADMKDAIKQRGRRKTGRRNENFRQTPRSSEHTPTKYTSVGKSKKKALKRSPEGGSSGSRSEPARSHGRRSSKKVGSKKTTTRKIKE
ncbi:MAG: hypothetical protein QOH49_2506 [Acidobacteriota bacterium]|jgi:hypothetical protein|nr:hypothetical protein [Acidobacteriota bacterium]